MAPGNDGHCFYVRCLVQDEELVAGKCGCNEWNRVLSRNRLLKSINIFNCGDIEALVLFCVIWLN